MTTAQTPSPISSVCVYCGSSNTANPAFLTAAAAFGKQLAAEGVRLVYGGGGVGLMGAAARAAHDHGGKVLGIMPDFLRSREILFDAVETVVVTSMHQRKMIMFEESDAFVVLPGGIGTLEEVVELLSWRRLDLHRKPIVFLDQEGFWQPFFHMIEHTIEQNLTPQHFRAAWRSVTRIEDLLPAIRAMALETGTVNMMPRAAGLT
jgi:uncharacterized protein (TIGR00730 family)